MVAAAPFRCLVMLPKGHPNLAARLLSGMVASIVSLPGWVIIHEPELASVEDFRRGLAAQRWDGILALPSGWSVGGPLHGLSLPVVTMANVEADLPGVLIDDVLVGKLAASHAGGPGRHQVVVGDWDVPWQQDRIRGWKAVYPDAPVHWITRDPRTSRDLLAHLPRPATLFALHDLLAESLVLAAHDLGLRVGSEVRIIGVDDSPRARLSRPTLSSIALPIEAVGRQAVRLLADVVAGRPVERRQRIPPLAVMRRASSDPLHDGPTWLQEIQEHLRMSVYAGESKTIPQLLSGFGRSRSTIERAWRATTGETLLDALRLLRCQVALERLQEGNRDLAAVAASLGLPGRRNLNRLLRQCLGGELADAMTMGTSTEVPIAATRPGGGP